MAESQGDIREPSTTQSDEQLISRAAAGHTESFDNLVRRYEGRLLRFLLQRLPNRADAEDVLQETFVRAYQYIGKFDRKRRFTTWLFTIGSREAVNFYRRAKKTIPLDEMNPAGGPDPAEIFHRRQQDESIWDLAKKNLSENQYIALWLRYAEDMPVRDIAGVMGKTQSYVRVLLFRSRAVMKDKLRA